MINALCMIPIVIGCIGLYLLTTFQPLKTATALMAGIAAVLCMSMAYTRFREKRLNITVDNIPYRLYTIRVRIVFCYINIFSSAYYSDIQRCIEEVADEEDFTLTNTKINNN